MGLYEPVKVFKAWSMILDSLVRPWNGSEDINITSVREILLKFVIVLKVFEYFCLFLSLTIITGH